MSKFIPNKGGSNYGGQVKPKLKVKVIINEEEKILNEYDAFTMISDVNRRISFLENVVKDLGEAVTGIMDGMKAAAGTNTSEPVSTTLKMPKLKSVKSNLDSSHIYGDTIDAPKLTD